MYNVLYVQLITALYSRVSQVWEREDYDDLTKRLASTLPHSHHFVNRSVSPWFH